MKWLEYDSLSVFLNFFYTFGFLFLKLELEDLKAPKISLRERIHVWIIFLGDSLIPGKFFLTNPKELSAAWFLGFAYFSLLVNNPFPVFRNFSVFCVIRSLSFFLVLLLLCIKFEALYQVWYFIRFVEFVSLVFSVLLELEWIIYCFEV